MENTGEKPSPDTPFNKLDLSALENFQFGTQWVGGGHPSGDKSQGNFGEGRGGPSRRDRRPGRRSFAEGGGGEGGAESAPPSGEQRPPRREGPAGGERREGFRGGERREGGPGRGAPYGRREGGLRPAGSAPGEGAAGGERREGGGRAPWQGHGPRREGGAPPPDRPYVSPTIEVVFYPDDSGFNALIKAMRASGRTYELFQIAQLLLEKNDRFIALIRRFPGADGKSAPLYLSQPEGVPFEQEEAAVRHALAHNLDDFFERVETEVEAPKGSFPFVSRCPHTGELLGPPNYHRYQQLLQQHHAEKVPQVPFERWKASLETVREPEAIAQWAEKMKKAVHYTSKLEVDGQKPVFQTRDEAITFLTTRLREKVVREVGYIRFPGRSFEKLPVGEIRRATEGALQRQRRFPLDTANALRGRLRREGFHLLKLPGKSITFVSAVKPRPRRPGQVFAETIEVVVRLIETRPFLTLKELERQVIGAPTGVAPASPAAPAAPEVAAPVAEPAAETAAPSPTAEAPAEMPAEAPVAPPAEPVYSDEQKARLMRLINDVRWLAREGYVVETADGRLYAMPVVAEPKPGNKAADTGIVFESHDEPPAASAQEETEAAPPAESEPSQPPPAAGV